MPDAFPSDLIHAFPRPAILTASFNHEATMDTTGRYELPLLMPSQAQKHVTHNEALTLLDTLVHPAIKTFGDTTPPPGVQIDDAFYVGPLATGDWFGESGKIAVFTDMGWRFVVVREGMTALDLGTDEYVMFDGSAWQPLGDHLVISSLPQLGINTAADSTNKLSVRSNAALLNALDSASGGTGDIRLTLNKEAVADTGSLVFQTGFSGRAEFGLTGDDDFHVKVSQDGSNWNEAITVNKATGQVTLAANSIGNAALADMASGTIKGRTSAGAGDPQDMTPAQTTALLDIFTTGAKGLAPASGGGTVNFLRADGAWTVPSGGGAPVDPLDLTATGVAAPASGTVRAFRKDQGGRQMLAFIGPTGMDTTVQPFLATNKVARWNPGGNSSSTPIVDGFPVAFTALGTATTRSVAATNFITRLRRFGFVSAATAGALCGHYSPAAQWTIGTGAGLGGFHYVCRFVPSDIANVSGARMFVGLRNAVTAPTNVEPNTLTNCIGLAQLSTSNNLHLVYGGSAAQTPIDLGASFPANGASAAAYELQLFASPVTQTIGYKVMRLDTGDTVSGILSGTVGTQVPAATTFLAHTAWRSNNATALACGLDVVSVYLETDN
jgi:Protein of unknown function (DUF2793)